MGTIRRELGALPSPIGWISADSLALWDGEVGRSHRRPENDTAERAAA